MQWSCDIYHVLVILQCYYLYYAWFYEAYPGASLFCEIKFQSVFYPYFLPIMIATLEWVRSQCRRPGQRVRQSRSQVTSRSRRLESGERESGHTGWVARWPPELDTAISQAYCHTHSNPNQQRHSLLTGKVKDCDSTKRIQLCFDGGI